MRRFSSTLLLCSLLLTQGALAQGGSDAATVRADEASERKDGEPARSEAADQATETDARSDEGEELVPPSDASAPGEADQERRPWAQQGGLTGDWGGARTSMVEAGVEPYVLYDAIPAANLAGGIENEVAYAGQLQVGLKLDWGALLGLKGLHTHVSGAHRHGETVAEEVGGIYNPMAIYGGQTYYLYRLWMEANFGPLSLKVGRDSSDSDVVFSPLYGYSLSTAINGVIRAAMLENVLTALPYAVWMARAALQPSDAHRFTVAAYHVGDRMWDFDRHGADFRIRSGDAASIVTQYDFMPKMGGRHARFFVGAINAVGGVRQLNGERRDHLFRAYAHAELEVFPGWTLWALGSYSPATDTAVTPLQVSGGFNAQGLIPGREDDRTVGFATYGQFSDSYGDVVGSDLTAESVFELGYRLQLLRSFSVQPSVQYVLNPGGTGNTDDAVVLGAWIALAL